MEEEPAVVEEPPVAEETPVKYVITVKDKDGNSLVENFTSTIYPLET